MREIIDSINVNDTEENKKIKEYLYLLIEQNSLEQKLSKKQINEIVTKFLHLLTPKGENK